MAKAVFYSVLLIINVTFSDIFSAVYLYPVETPEVPSEKFSIFLLQKQQTTQLILFDHASQLLDPLLLPSLHCPAALSCIPGTDDYTFLDDDGLIKIKEKIKRSAYPLALDEPLGYLYKINWFNKNQGYCSAQKGDFFALFEVNRTGGVVELLARPGCDYLYPQKIDNLLFAIERKAIKAGCAYAIMVKKYDDKNDGGHKIWQGDEEGGAIFLRMDSPKKGFFIQYNPKQLDDNAHLVCNYCLISYQSGVWQKEILFTFTIPVYLFSSPTKKVYEGFLPFLPYHAVGDSIYFVSASADGILNLFSYTQQLKSINQLTFDTSHRFGIARVNGRLMVGGELENEEEKNKTLSFWLSQSIELIEIDKS